MPRLVQTTAALPPITSEMHGKEPAKQHTTTHPRSHSAQSHARPPRHVAPPPPADNAALGCGLVALVVGLFLLRAIPWPGGMLSLVGGVLVLQWVGSFGAAGWLVVGVCVLAVLAIAVKLAGAQTQKVAVLEAGPLTPVRPSGVVAVPGETFYWQEPAKWLEFHTERQYAGGSGGLSFRVARGVSLRTGSTGGRSRPVTVANTTPGTVYLSDRRILFISSAFSREILLKSVLHFGKGRGFIHIDLPNASSIQVETGNNGLNIALDKILTGRAQTATVDPALPKRAIPAHAATPVKTDVGTKKSVVDRLVALLDKTFPALQEEHDAARTSPPAPAGALLTQQQSLAWIHEKITFLATLGATVKKIAVTDLATALSPTEDVEPSSAAQEKWVHECSTFCYQLIDWELDVKTANLDPLFAHAQTLMRGLTDTYFSPIMQIRTQLAAIDAPNFTGPIRVATEATADLIKPLNAEIERITDLMTKLKG